MVDHFEISRPIGRGGMGEVYLARDMKLGRKVALKVILPESIGSREAIDRFLFEAKTTARFNHPHIVTIHDVGEYQGCPYMALEYLEGQSLRERMEERPSVRESLRIGLAIAEALRAAHQHDILHRDLKPENVLLPRDGTLRVLDFGLAKPVVTLPETPALASKPTVPELEDQRIATADTMSNLDVTLSPFETEAGQVQGTPSYMAPEQWMDQPSSPSTDIWAFGVVLRELITGRRPFEELKAVQLAFSVCSDDPVPKMEAVPDAPAELNTILDQCVEKDPQKRPSSSEVVEALERMVYRGRGHLSDEESPFRGLLPFAERHADFFFGREAEIGAFLERVREGSVLPIVGPSGVGKSSFVQAGVIPRLKEQGHWLVYRLRPGRRPFQALASRLLAGQTSVMTLLTSARGQTAVQAATDDADAEERRAEEKLPEELATLPDKLFETPSVLALLLQQVAREQKSRVLLYLDQLEELYTLVQDERTRRRFMEAVCTAADDPQGPVRVILTLRDDFLSRLARGALVREAFSQVTVLSDPYPEALEEILVKPLEPTGYSYDDPALVPEMIEAVRGESAALPLLQFTTRMLWDSRDRKGRKLLRATYEAMGGVAGALAKHADGVLEGLSPAEVAVARDILLRLVTPDGTRQALAQTQLLDQLGPEAGEILDRLTSARLITVRKAHAAALDAGGAELELVHESLIRGWRQLARWMDEGREELAFRAEVAEAAKLWDKRGRRDEEVWRGDALYDALRVLERCTAQLPDLERSFINAGSEREERVQRRKRRRLAINGGLLVLITLISVVVAISFGKQKREATKQRAMAEDRRAAAQIESASSALARVDLLEARAQLRASLETKDSTLGRALWMRLGADPLIWRRELGATAFDVAISPDGRSVAAACQDRSIYLFDEQTLAMRVLRGHQDQAVSVALSPKGDLIASGTWDGRVRIWNARRGTVTRVLKGHKAWVWQLVFSPDGRQLASASWDKTIRIWNLHAHSSTSTAERVLKGHTDRVYGLVFSPDGRQLASGGFDKSIRIWNPRTGKQEQQLLGHTDRVYGLAYSPDGRHLASGSLDRTIRIWSPESNAVEQVLQGHTGGVYSVVWANTPAGQRIVSGSWDHTIRLWDPRTGDELKQLRGHTGGIYSVAINPAGTRVASASTDKTVRYWSLTERAGDEQRSAGHGTLVWEATFSPDGKLLASGGQDKRVIIWDVASGRSVKVLDGHTAMVTGLAVSPDGRTLASASSDRTVRLWDLDSGAEKNVLLGHTASVYGLAFSPDGKHLASGSSDKTVRLWDTTAGKLVRVLTGHTSEVFGVVFSPDGRRLASASRDRTVRLWEVMTGRQLRELRGHEGSVTGLAISPDGRTLASGSDDRSVRLWDIDRGTSRILGTHEGRVYFLSFSPDGKRIASPSSDGTARIWEVQSGRHLTLLGHRSEVNAARFSPNGEQVATTSDDGTVRLWSATTGHQVWRSPGLLSSPNRIFSHQGWTSLGPSHRPGGVSSSRSMDRAVEQSARLSESGGRIVCLQTRGGRVEQWDARSDRRLFEDKVPGITAVVATPRGCLALVKGTARLYAEDGTHQELLREATAMAFSNGMILVAAGREIHTFDVAGRRQAATYEVGVGVSTMTWLDDRLAIGFEEGNIELVSLRGGERHPAISFREIPSSPVVRLLAGPMHTLIGGYANGLVGIWNVRTGRRLYHTRLHGPVRHIVEKGPRIVAVTDLGDHRTIDMGVFHWDYCDLLQQVWQRVVVRWEGGLLVPRPPPRSHPCNSGQ